MARWIRLHLSRGTYEGKRIISEAKLNFLHQPQTFVASGKEGHPDWAKRPLLGEGAYYAQGWVFIYDQPCPIIWHNGGTTGSKSVVAFAPRAGVGIVVLSNLGGTLVPEILAQWFFDRYFGNKGKDWNQELLNAQIKAGTKKDSKKAEIRGPKSPALPRSSYTGNYANEVFGSVTLSPSEGGLVMTIGPDKVKIFLRHSGRDNFMWTLPSFQDEGAPAYFQIDDSGKAVILILDQLNESGEGTFHRVGK
jgi:CubicO group peptidase (beta-lactamase class C family)